MKLVLKQFIPIKYNRFFPFIRCQIQILVCLISLYSGLIAKKTDWQRVLRDKEGRLFTTDLKSSNKHILHAEVPVSDYPYPNIILN